MCDVTDVTVHVMSTVLFCQFEKYESGEEGEGANCNRIIMFLTDGGTEMPEEVFKKYNWPEKKVSG